MWISLVRVSPAAFSRIKGEPTLLDSIFFDGDQPITDLGIGDDDTAGFDYRLALDALEGMAEATGEDLGDGDAVLADLAVTGVLDYDVGYGPAFYIDPAGVKKAVDSMACHMDEDVAALIQGASADGEYLVGVIS
jgi:hypothetical protein